MSKFKDFNGSGDLLISVTVEKSSALPDVDGNCLLICRTKLNIIQKQPLVFNFILTIATELFANGHGGHLICTFSPAIVI